MTAFRIRKDANEEILVMEQELEDGRQGHFFNVDFVNTVGETGMNCAGISAPNGRIWTAEEWFRSSTSSIYEGVFRTADRDDSWNPHSPAPSNVGYGVRDTSTFTIDAPEFPLVDGMEIDKYENFNYMTEIDPIQAKAIRKQYNWGRAGWEGGAITEDGKYAYLGIDGTPAPFVRFEADEAWDFTKGKITVFKHDNPAGSRWVEVPESVENVFGGLTASAFELGATMYVRNEWVAIDNTTGKVYWTETGRDSGSSGPGRVFIAATAVTNAVVSPHHNEVARERGFDSALDTLYQDYYGRVLEYDPATEEVSVTIHGGPYLENSPMEADYPSTHLSNPDGLSIMEIDGQTFLVIQEDLNGTSFGRTPDGVSNRLCEMYLLSTAIENPTLDDLIKITAVPAGAEITGAIQIDENTMLVNAQHPNANNPFPYNHSVTIAIHGFAQLTTSNIKNPDLEDEEIFAIHPNPTSRMIYLSKSQDFAIYNAEGSRIRVLRNTNRADLSELPSGVYYVKAEAGEIAKIVVQKYLTFKVYSIFKGTRINSWFPFLEELGNNL